MIWNQQNGFFQEYVSLCQMIDPILISIYTLKIIFFIHYHLHSRRILINLILLNYFLIINFIKNYIQYLMSE